MSLMRSNISSVTFQRFVGTLYDPLLAMRRLSFTLNERPIIFPKQEIDELRWEKIFSLRSRSGLGQKKTADR